MIYYLAVQNSDRTVTKTYQINCTELRKKGDVYDSLNVDNLGHVFYTKRLKYVNGELERLLVEQKMQLDDITIELFEGINYLFLIDDTRSILSVKYILKNDFTNEFTTVVEMRSEIKQEADRIDAKVSSITDDEGNITSASLILAINKDEGSTAKLKADRIGLEGYVSINGGFGVDLEGNMYARNGSFEGDIFLGEGKKILGGDGLLTNIQDASNIDFIGFGLRNISEADADSMSLGLKFEVFIPKGFKVASANVSVILAPVEYEGHTDYPSSRDYDFWGYARQVSLFKNMSDDYSTTVHDHAEYEDLDELSLTEIEGAFGENGYTPPTAPTDESHPTYKIVSEINLNDYLEEGLNEFVVMSRMENPKSEGDFVDQRIYENTGRGYAVINVFGYLPFTEENEEEEINTDDIENLEESEDILNDLGE